MSHYGIYEIAKALGENRNTVAVWYRRGKLPPPDDTLRMGPLWHAETIEQWIDEQRRR